MRLCVGGPMNKTPIAKIVVFALTFRLLRVHEFDTRSRPRTMPQMWHAVREKPVPAHPKVQVIRVGQTYMSKLRRRVWQLGFTSRSRTQVQSIVPHPGWSQLYMSPFVWYCVTVTFSCGVL